MGPVKPGNRFRILEGPLGRRLPALCLQSEGKKLSDVGELNPDFIHCWIPPSLDFLPSPALPFFTFSPPNAPLPRTAYLSPPLIAVRTNPPEQCLAGCP